MKRSVVKDQGGAILVMGLFMGVLLVALLYYLAGIGEGLVLRGQMQDAADASAYSAAVIHARGMNIIVMINVLMAALLAVLVLLKLISTICTIAIAICIALAFWTGGSSLAPVGMLENVREITNTLYDNLKDPIHEILGVGNTLAVAVREAAPLAAQAAVVNLSRNVYRPPTELAVMFPLYEALPTEDDDFSVLCGKAGEMVGEAADAPLRAIFGHPVLSGLLGGVLGGLAKTFASYFCGDGGVNAPSLTYEEKVDHPRLDTPEAKTCDAEREKTGARDQSVLNGDCKEAGKQTKLAVEAVDKDTGECKGAGADLCQRRTEAARTECRPGATPNLKRWWWRTEVRERRYRLVEDPRPRVIVVGEDAFIQSNKEGGNKGKGHPPCHSGAGWDNTWNTDSSKPVCSERVKKPNAADMKRQGIRETSVRYTVVADILNCQSEHDRKVEITDTLSEDEGGDGESKSPQRVKACASLGGDAFQIRVAAVGDTARLERFEPGVGLATWGKGAGSGDAVSTWARRFGKFAFAQAEYYWSGPGPGGDSYDDWRGDWMWTMAWQARYRRLGLAGEDECGNDTSESSESSGAFEELEKLFMH